MKNLRIKLNYVFYTLLVCVFISCSNPTADQMPTNNVKKKRSGISFIGRYEIEEGGMKYVVYREVDGGLFILNITKDSLDVERLRNVR